MRHKQHIFIIFKKCFHRNLLLNFDFIFIFLLTRDRLGVVLYDVVVSVSCFGCWLLLLRSMGFYFCDHVLSVVFVVDPRKIRCCLGYTSLAIKQILTQNESIFPVANTPPVVGIPDSLMLNVCRMAVWQVMKGSKP